MKFSARANKERVRLIDKKHFGGGLTERETRKLAALQFKLDIATRQYIQPQIEFLEALDGLRERLERNKGKSRL